MSEIGREIDPIPMPFALPSRSAFQEDPRLDLDEGDHPPSPTSPALRRSFAVLSRPGDPMAPSSYEMVEARLRALGDRIQIYVDEDDVAEVGDDVLRGLVSCFERRIEPTLSPWIGRPIDADRDGRFAVLFSRRISRPFDDRCHVDGYFRATDLDANLPRPLSNRADLVYLEPHLRPGPYLETVLAHEYAHAVLASRRIERLGPVTEEAWLDEAITHLCEDRVARSTSNLDYRVGAFLSDPARYRLIVDDETRPGRFRSHGSRGASYLFLRWCADHLDPDLPRSLSLGTATGVENLEQVLGLPFQELHRRWTLAVALGSLGTPSLPSGGLDLLGAIGDWPIDGVRFDELGPDEETRSDSIEGTGTRFFRLLPDPSGPTRIEVRCGPESSPVLTALILDRSLPRLELDVSMVRIGAESADLVARFEHRSGAPVRLDRLSWEPLHPSPALPRHALFAGSIEGDRLHSLFDRSGLEAGEHRLSRRFEIPSEQLRPGPLVFRLSARTPEGNRIVCWAELDPNAPPPSGRRSTLAGRHLPADDDSIRVSP